METYFVWYLATGLLLLAEAMTPGTFIYVCFGIGALIIAFVDQFSNLEQNLLVAMYFGVSALLLILVKPILKKYMMPESDINFYTKKLIGQEGMVYKPIDEVQLGTVQLFEIGETWIAKASDGSKIGEGTTVKVMGVQGNVLIVEAKVK